MRQENSGKSRIFKREFLAENKASEDISPENFEILEALRLDFRLLLVNNCNKSNALNTVDTIVNCRAKVVTKL